jgi:hypothetical protein
VSEVNQTITIGDKEYTLEQLQDLVNKYPELEKSYKKLEAEFTKTSQAKKELESKVQAAEQWLQFSDYLQQHPDLAKQIADVVDGYNSGNPVTQANLNTISRAIDKADKAGDDELVKRLEALEAALQERQIEETLDSLEKRAKSDGLEDFTLDGFKEFADKWLEEELGLGDDDDITPKELRLAYTAYKAHLLEQTKERGKVPKVSSDSTGAPPAKEKDDRPKGLKARAQEALEYLRRH